mgnify:CR=1 FL=1
MWLSSPKNQNIYWYVIRLVGIAFFGLGLAACSDMSIHQLGQDNQDNLKKIMVTDIKSREGQIYTRELRKKLHVGGKSNEAYLLNSTIKTTSSATLSVQGAASSLKKMSMTTTFELSDLETGKTLFSDTISGDATLGAVSSFYGQDKSESHARERLAILLAQRVGRRLQLYFLEQKQ